MADPVSGKTKVPPAVDGWVYLRHPDITQPGPDGEVPALAPHRVPDDPEVVAYWEARGWERTEAPEDAPAVPDNTQTPPGDEDGWVELEHPETKARHRFPADPSAVALAQESGWRVPKDEPEAEPAKKTAKKAAAPAADSTEE